MITLNHLTMSEQKQYMSEAAKVRDRPQVMKYIKGDVLDIGCGNAKITDDAFGVDGRPFNCVNRVTSDPYWFGYMQSPFRTFDTIFSSHMLEHLPDQWGAINAWSAHLRLGGHLILYLPHGKYYDNKENEEHMIDMNYEDFMFWFKRSFCGEGKNFKGEYIPKVFEVVESGLDIGYDKYSFFVVARKV